MATVIEREELTALDALYDYKEAISLFPPGVNICDRGHKI
jgi:hypothetical protein